MSSRNPLLQPVPPYRLLGQTGGADHVQGEAIVPGSRTWGHRPENVVFELPVRAGARIAPGDLITRSAARTGNNPWTAATETTFTYSKGYAAHPVSASTSTATASDLGWGNVYNGVYQALNYVDNLNGADGAQSVSVYGQDAIVECYLEAGISPGEKVACDLRPYNDDGNGLKGTLTATDYVSDSYDINQFTTSPNSASPTAITDTDDLRRAAAFFMRVRSIAQSQVDTTVTRRAFVGTLLEIVQTNTFPDKDVKAYSQLDKVSSSFMDVGFVRLGGNAA